MNPDAETLKNEGNELYKAKNYRGAIDAYSKAIILDSENATLYTNRAASHLMLLQNKEASEDCTKAIALDNTNFKAYFRKATALKGLGKLDEAISTISIGLQYDEKNAAALQDKAVLLQAKETLKKIEANFAVKQYRQVLIQVDQLISVLGTNIYKLNLIKIKALVELQRPEEAINLSNVMMKTASTGDIELLHVRAKCLYLMGDIPNSVKHLQSCMRSDPDNTEIRTFLRKLKEMEETKEQGNKSFKAGAFADAIAAWTTCINLDSNNRSYNSKLYCNRANALLKLKRPEEAARDCDRAINADPDFIKAYIRRAEANYAIGTEDRLKNCISDYEKVQEMVSGKDDAGEMTGVDVRAKIKEAKIALKRTKQKDFYSILNVPKDADDDEIKKAYRKAALKFHPDKQGSKSEEEKAIATAKFKDIGEAYDVLSDPEKKQRYDEGVDVEDLDNPNAGHGGHQGHGGVDPNVLFEMFMRQGGGGCGGRGGGMRFHQG